MPGRVLSNPATLSIAAPNPASPAIPRVKKKLNAQYADKSTAKGLDCQPEIRGCDVRIRARSNLQLSRWTRPERNRSDGEVTEAEPSRSRLPVFAFPKRTPRYCGLRAQRRQCFPKRRTGFLSGQNRCPASVKHLALQPFENTRVTSPTHWDLVEDEITARTWTSACNVRCALELHLFTMSFRRLMQPGGSSSVHDRRTKRTCICETLC